MDGAIQHAPQPMRQSMLCFRENLLDDLFEYRIGLGTDDEILILEDERGHAGESIFTGKVDVGGYLRIEDRVGQRFIEVLCAQADLSRYLFQKGLIVNRAGLLPVCLHDGIVENLSFSLRLGILVGDQGGATVDAEWAGVYFQTILFACSFLKEWARRFYLRPALRRNGRGVRRSKFKRSPANSEFVVLLKLLQTGGD